MYQREYLDCNIVKEISNTFAGWFTLEVIYRAIPRALLLLSRTCLLVYKIIFLENALSFRKVFQFSVCVSIALEVILL